jgi:hypothetical protein
VSTDERLRMIRVYLSGPISGYEISERRAAFGVTADRLVARGFAVVNPLEVVTSRCAKPDCGTDAGHSWECWMRHDIAELVTCDELAYLPGSHDSRGARFEADIASRLGMPVRPIAEYMLSDL